MKIILKQDVKNLGFKDDLVEVKNGYANNFLFPKLMAVIASKSNVKVMEENVRQAKFKQEKIKQDATVLSEKMEGVKVQLGAKVGSNGKIFGSITPLQVSQSLKTKGFEVDRRKIVFMDDPKSVGEFQAKVNLHREVSVNITVEVIAE